MFHAGTSHLIPIPSFASYHEIVLGRNTLLAQAFKSEVYFCFTEAEARSRYGGIDGTEQQCRNRYKVHRINKSVRLRRRLIELFQHSRHVIWCSINLHDDQTRPEWYARVAALLLCPSLVLQVACWGEAISNVDTARPVIRWKRSSPSPNIVGKHPH